jgi:hypothetical protein
MDMRRDEIARDMVLFQNATRRNMAVGPTVMGPGDYLVLHVEQFHRYITRDMVDGRRVRIVGDPKRISKPILAQNGTNDVPAMRLDPSELAGYEDIYGEPPPMAAPKRSGAKKNPKPKVLEW